MDDPAPTKLTKCTPPELIQRASPVTPFKKSLAWQSILHTPTYLLLCNDNCPFRSGENGRAVKSIDPVLFEKGRVLTAGDLASANCIPMSDFQLCRELGRGQYGQVLLVKYKPSQLKMGLKLIKLELDAAGMKPVIMELNVLKRAHSPLVVTFYGALYNRSLVMLCIEHMDCGSLENVYRQIFSVPEPILAAISFLILKGLCYLYKDLRIMHRDVKPSNILINRKGEVKLCDFGISGHLVKSMARTQIGSVSYMAPERITIDEPSPYSIKADIWSFGASIYEAAVGHQLYEASNYDSPFSQLMSILQEPAPKLDPGRFSPSFCDFVDRCLEKDPEKRYTYTALLEHSFLARFKDQNERAQEAIREWLALFVSNFFDSSENANDGPPASPS